jgi:RimJ/RimL family protein N-acetyltransferase
MVFGRHSSIGLFTRSIGSRAIGTCDLSEIDQHHRRAEIGFAPTRASLGEGLCVRSDASCDRAMYASGIERLSARTHAGNDRSALLLKRLGFALEGTLQGCVVRADPAETTVACSAEW